MQLQFQSTLMVILMGLSAGASVFAQQGPKFSEVLVDPGLKNSVSPLSESNLATRIPSKMTVITNTKTKKSDTLYPAEGLTLKNNSLIIDKGRSHYGFDNCSAFRDIENDTLTLQFQNTNVEAPGLDFWDRILVKVIGSRCYASYIYSSNSYFKLTAIDQKLTLGKLVFKHGEHIRGYLSVTCADVGSNLGGLHTIILFGDFDAIVQ